MHQKEQKADHRSFCPQQIFDRKKAYPKTE